MLRSEAPIARFVVVTLLLLALVLSAGLGALDHLTERARLQVELRDSARVQADQLAASLALPVWNFDQSQIVKIAESVLHDREAAGMIVRIADRSAPSGSRLYGLLRDDAGKISQITADVPAGINIAEDRPLLANDQPVGSVTVFYTPQYMEQALRDNLLHQIWTFVAFGTILAAGLYLLLWRTVLRPLVSLQRYAAEVSTGNSAPPARGKFRGELERLRRSLEEMVQLLAARYASLQQNQTMLSAVLNSTPQSIFWKDATSRYLGCNEPFARIAGNLSRPELIVGKTDFDLPWPRAAAEVYRTDDHRVIASGTARHHIVEPLQPATGAMMTVETTKVPLVDAAGKVYGVLGVFEDITARLEDQRRIASQLHFEELVARISAALVAAQPDNLTQILSRALGEIAELLNADRLVLARTEEASGHMVARAHFRLSDPPFPERLDISDRYPSLWRQMRVGTPSHIPSVADLGPNDAVDRAHFQEVGIQSQITVPVIVENRLQYLLAVSTVNRLAGWTDETLARIRVLADLLGTTALRCEAEEIVRSSERQFRTFIEQAPVPILLVPSPDGSPFYFNPAFTRIFGYTRQDLPRPEDWWPTIYPDPQYRQTRRAAWEAIAARATETGAYQDAEEAEMTTKSGAVRYAEVRLTIVAGYRMSFINDLTARRQAETALRLTQYAVDHNPVMIFHVNMDGCIVYANDAACTQFSYNPAEMLRLHTWNLSAVYSQENWPQRLEFFRQQGGASFESVYTTRHGHTFPAEVRIQYVEFSGQKLFVVFGFDITQRKAAQEAEHAYTRRIQKLAAELTRAEERQRRELASTLHDGVGQNLFATTTQLLALRTRIAADLPEVDKALSLLDQITRDTRELTFELCPPVLYQLGLIPALQRLADQFTARYHIPCTLVGTTAGPEDLNVRGLAYQAVRELLNNVAKHAAAQHVTISAREVDGHVVVEVLDDGIGFEGANLLPGAGGFGLFHVRERIELLGGNLEIYAAPGSGSRVQFALPMKIRQPMG